MPGFNPPPYVWMYLVHGRHFGIPAPKPPKDSPSLVVARRERRRQKRKNAMSSASSNPDQKPKKFQSDMVVIAEYHPDEILPFTGPRAEPEEFEVNGKFYRVRMDSLRYQTFNKSRKCVSCGIEGTVMRLEHGFHADARRPHFNLYAIMEDGSPLLMTRDHIVPRSAGGTDQLSNQQCMCTLCNGLKGSLSQAEFEEMKRRDPA